MPNRSHGPAAVSQVEEQIQDYLRRYAGGDSFLLSLKSWTGAGKRLTPRQLEAALRIVTREADLDRECTNLRRAILIATHPDRGTDEGDRKWRTRFSALTNAAYDARDLSMLIWIHALVIGE